MKLIKTIYKINYGHRKNVNYIGLFDIDICFCTYMNVCLIRKVVHFMNCIYNILYTIHEMYSIEFICFFFHIIFNWFLKCTNTSIFIWIFMVTSAYVYKSRLNSSHIHSIRFIWSKLSSYTYIRKVRLSRARLSIKMDDEKTKTKMVWNVILLASSSTARIKYPLYDKESRGVFHSHYCSKGGGKRGWRIPFLIHLIICFFIWNILLTPSEWVKLSENRLKEIGSRLDKWVESLH